MSTAITLHVPMAVGDVLDRLTILAIKVERAALPEARANVQRELLLLADAWRAASLGEWQSDPDAGALSAVNVALWEVEDELRHMEARADFGAAFVAAARSVYQLNDRRAALKRQVSQRLGSALVEEKLYGTSRPA
jgi:hypothetical protein